VVDLICAFPLNDKEQKEFSEKLTQRMQGTISLRCTTDKRIIGGAIIRAGDRVIDGSVRGRLDKLADSMGILN
jgi:F-type H+-transporting ATPase subunit delta